jgi:hypothetical protein
MDCEDVNWIHLTQLSQVNNSWEEANEFSGFMKFFTNWATTNFSRRTLLVSPALAACNSPDNRHV